jgi:hypothetical protein
MSSSFCTTIGWGMPWIAFEEAFTLDCETQDTWEVLEHTFENADQSLFEIDPDVYDRADFSTEPSRAPYLTPHSLRSNVLEREDDKFILGRPTELYQRIDVSEEGDDDHIVFYPDCYYADGSAVTTTSTTRSFSNGKREDRVTPSPTALRESSMSTTDMDRGGIRS